MIANSKKAKETKVNPKNTDPLKISDKPVEEVDSFVYLGSTMTKEGGAENDVQCRINKTNSAFVQLFPIWRNRDISRTTEDYTRIMLRVRSSIFHHLNKDMHR